jgi:hypothetical protein
LTDFAVSEQDGGQAEDLFPGQHSQANASFPIELSKLPMKGNLGSEDGEKKVDGQPVLNAAILPSWRGCTFANSSGSSGQSSKRHCIQSLPGGSA